mgnify:CR=1 FL=1
MELSIRLKTIADMVTEGRIADVGCDHGFVSIYLCKCKNASKVYAMDVRPGPLKSARKNIAAYQCSDYIETRLSDGLTALMPGEADALVCAGMGGSLMVKILSDGYDKILTMKELILQPQSELRFFREYLRTHGIKIVQENMVKEEGKFYPIIKAVPSQNKDLLYDVFEGAGFFKEAEQRISDSFGPLLLRERNPVLLDYLEYLWERNKNILTKLNNQKLQMKHRESSQEAYNRICTRHLELVLENEDIEKCLAFYEEGAAL